MSLSKRQVRTLVEAVANTRESEIDCDACLSGMAAFADHELVGAAVPEAAERIRAHLAVCPECAEEYELLLETLASSS